MFQKIYNKFPKNIQKLVKKSHDIIFSPGAVAKNNRISKIISHIDTNSKILDVGCVRHDLGRNSNTPWLHEELHNCSNTIHGIDIVEDQVELMEQSGFDVDHADAQDFDLNKEFDTIFAGEIIEHLSNFKGFFKSMDLHLKEGGKIIISTPNVHYFPVFVKSITNNVSVNEEHTCWFDKTTLSQLVERNGYYIDKFDYVKFSPFKPIWHYRNIEYLISDLMCRLGFENIGGYRMVIVIRRQKDREGPH